MNKRKSAESRDMDEMESADCCYDVHSDNVALPEVRTGELDAEDDFAKTQDERNKKQRNALSLEAVAIPEFHTGKVSAQETNEDADARVDKDEKSGKKHHLLGDLVHTLLNGSSE